MREASQGGPEPGYEASIQRLREVVERLERGDLGLEESLALFREGSLLARRCEARLKEVEDEIQVLVAGGAAGEAEGSGPGQGGWAP